MNISRVNNIKELHMDFTKVAISLTALVGDRDEPDMLETGLSTSEIHVKSKQNQEDREEEFSSKQLIEKLEQLIQNNTILVPSYTTLQLIEQVNNGYYIHRCIKSSSIQNISKSANRLQAENQGVDLLLKTNYKRHKDGTLEMANPILLKKQKQVLGYLLKQFGSAILSGKSVMQLSLPVSIFESRSLLERTANSFTHAPHFLERAAQTSSTMEQFKLSIACFLSSLSVDMNPEKPFNPILGETFQGLIGNVPFYAEQISHHPPICAYQMIGDQYSIQGLKEFNAAMSANSVKSKYYGYPSITFKNTGNCIQAQYPVGVMQGTAIGKRTFHYTGTFYIFDIKNQLYCEIEFDLSESIFKKKKNPKDHYSGKIWKVTEKFMDKLKSEVKHHREIDLKFKEKDHAIQELCTLQGCWLDNLIIGDETYWSFGHPWPYELHYFDNPLPSDSNFRLDILHLRAGDETKAQESKNIFEENQRKDRKLREQYKHKHKK